MILAAFSFGDMSGDAPGPALPKAKALCPSNRAGNRAKIQRPKTP